jgi:hypothetical protein
MKQWASRIKNAHLPVHLVWKAYRYKLWPGVRYGIATLATPLSATTSLLHSLEFKILGSMGVNRHIKTEWRTLAREFGGIGLYSLTIEQADRAYGTEISPRSFVISFVILLCNMGEVICTPFEIIY